GASESCCGTSIVTPEVCDWGVTASDHVPAPSPASDAISSIERTCAPVETSIFSNESDCGAVNTFGSSAAPTSASPAPSSSTDAPCVRAVPPQAARAVAISADLICHGAQFGCRSTSTAAAPAMCGVAIEVPAKTANVEPVVRGGVDDSTSRPGAAMSG